MSGMLEPDDDYLVAMARYRSDVIGLGGYHEATAHASRDWRHSLSHQGQIAVRGLIETSALSRLDCRIKGRHII